MSIKMNELYSINKAGEECEPHRYPDKKFRAVRRIPGDDESKNEEYYIIFPERELAMMWTDKELSIRMSPIKDRKNPALFKTIIIFKRP